MTESQITKKTPNYETKIDGNKQEQVQMKKNTIEIIEMKNIVVIKIKI